MGPYFSLTLRAHTTWTSLPFRLLIEQMQNPTPDPAVEEYFDTDKFARAYQSAYQSHWGCIGTGQPASAGFIVPSASYMYSNEELYTPPTSPQLSFAGYHQPSWGAPAPVMERPATTAAPRMMGATTINPSSIHPDLRDIPQTAVGPMPTKVLDRPNYVTTTFGGGSFMMLNMRPRATRSVNSTYTS